jgi:hypothetical protein
MIFSNSKRTAAWSADGARELTSAPSPPSELRAWAAALALFAFGVLALVAVLSGWLGTSEQQTSVPPPVLAVASTPVATGAEQAAFERLHEHPVSKSAHRSIVASPSPLQQSREVEALNARPSVHIPRSWMDGFYPIYATAQKTFGVNWLLLASIHMQESAFSTASSTYHGLNFAGCCGGPMQFNVTNGPVSTWDEVSNSYIYGKRPAVYDHMTVKHPSIYDDFDAIMAAAHLLSVDGAGYALDGSAWDAAYDYYGHDATGVAYADEVIARAIGWSQHGFCINCGVDSSLQAAVHAAYGAPVLGALEASSALKATLARVTPHRSALATRHRR